MSRRASSDAVAATAGCRQARSRLAASTTGLAMDLAGSRTTPPAGTRDGIRVEMPIDRGLVGGRVVCPSGVRTRRVAAATAARRISTGDNPAARNGWPPIGTSMGGPPRLALPGLQTDARGGRARSSDRNWSAPT
jgi:hypothetical protein